MSEATIMHRRGTSLMEVLIAIFILALGLISLLTLFPIGFVQMTKSVQDERAAQLAANAASYMRTMWKDACEASARNTPGGQPLFTDAISLNSFWSAMDDPNLYMTDDRLFKYLPTNNLRTQPVVIQQPISDPTLPPFPLPPPPAGLTTVDVAMQRLITQGKLTASSYPVFVDPVGWEARNGSGAQQTWLGYRGNNAYAIPRRRIPQMAMTTFSRPALATDINLMFDYKKATLRNCMLQDDMEFTFDGVAKLSDRVAQYSCAWLLRRDNNNKRTETNMTVVVYHRRSIETPSDEAVYWGTSIPPSVNGTYQWGTSLTMHYVPGQKPALRRGGWILDATMYPISNNGPIVIHGFYYRVTDIGDEHPSATYSGELEIDLQLETPIRAGIVGSKKRVIIVQDRVLEVFDKGPLEMNSPSRIN